jgi:hypothetical protein
MKERRPRRRERSVRKREREGTEEGSSTPSIIRNTVKHHNITYLRLVQVLVYIKRLQNARRPEKSQTQSVCQCQTREAQSTWQEQAGRTLFYLFTATASCQAQTTLLHFSALLPPYSGPNPKSLIERAKFGASDTHKIRIAAPEYFGNHQ